MNIVKIVEKKLKDALSPTQLKITDQSEGHAGHSGQAEGAAHLTVRIVSSKFESLSEVQRQRLVYKALAQEMTGAIHALVIEAKTPNEVP